MTRWPCLAACLLLIAAVVEPGQYRMDQYRAPTPATLQGAQVVSTEEARVLWQGKEAAFIDVLPQVPKPGNLPAGTLWRQQPHDDIPGSIWLPDTGYGALSPPLEAYFSRGLVRASGNDKDHLLVFYCLPDCWMSWNAAKRALALGYRRVAWYPDGVVGWQKAGLPIEHREPEQRPAP